MIQQKLDLKTLITALNELEKLKLLLFDQDQYYLFEHIPKPFLIDANAARRAQERQRSKMGKKPKLRGEIRNNSKRKSCGDILISNNSFWKKIQDEEVALNQFASALSRIKHKRESEINIIDRRLLEILNEMNIG